MNTKPVMIKDGIDIASLLSAYEQFRSALRIAQSDLEKAGTIKYFEFTYELAWKTMKRILALRGKVLNSPRTIFREAALEGLITNPEHWFEFLDDRNETVHLYVKVVAAEIFNDLSSFDREMQQFVDHLKTLI